MRKGQIKEFCNKCGTKRKQLNNGRYVCSKCQRDWAREHYHKNKRPLTNEQKIKKKISNLKWKHTLRDSGFTNQQITVIKSRYKLEEIDLVRLVDKQKGKCFICGKDLDKRKDLCVDHCHTTGKIRGLLCRDCNFALGLFKNNIYSLKKAIEYLINSQ